MEYDWTNRPTKIRNWERGIDYVMFVDENGNSDITNTLKSLSQHKEVDINDKYFTVTGCIFSKYDYKIAKEKMNDLKNNYWQKGTFLYKEHEQKVCFHSRDIRRRENAFNKNLINYEKFIIDLTTMISSLQYKIISVTIDKENYLLKRYHFNTYNTAMCFLLQRYIYVMPNYSRGLVMLEARGKEEDKLLLNEMKHIIFETGIRSITVDELKQKISGIYFNPKWNQNYDDTFSGLEIADLSSYPIHKYIRNNKKDKAFLSIENKIDKYPNYTNKGLKVFP